MQTVAAERLVQCRASPPARSLLAAFDAAGGWFSASLAVESFLTETRVFPALQREVKIQSAIH